MIPLVIFICICIVKCVEVGVTSVSLFTHLYGINVSVSPVILGAVDMCSCLVIQGTCNSHCFLKYDLLSALTYVTTLSFVSVQRLAEKWVYFTVFILHQFYEGICRKMWFIYFQTRTHFYRGSINFAVWSRNQNIYRTACLQLSVSCSQFGIHSRV